MSGTEVGHLRQDIETAAQTCSDHKTADFLAQVLDHWPESSQDLSDGFHTFGELYQHRCLLFIALQQTQADAWWSLKHHPDNDPIYQGMVVAGFTAWGQEITYHLLADEYMPLLKRAGIRELPHAPKWDGYTPSDVLHRLTAMIAFKEKTDDG